ncbi:unnamed protein product [Amaranthus hypochondriacus]
MEMEEERIGMVLVRASELRSKIANCIHHSTTEVTPNNGDSDPSSVDEDTEALLNICYAFDSLESQLASLQALRQQQQYEKEAVIGDIELSRKALLKKLSEYKGEQLDVIREAEAFASMKVEHDNELLLPPYPVHSPHSLVLDKSYPSRGPYSRILSQNALNGGNATNNSQTLSKPNKLTGGLKFLVHSIAKMVLTTVGVISLLNLAGYEPRLQKKGTNNINILTLFQRPCAGKRGIVAHCPPGKVAVMENGEIRCIVKERVEIPFDSAAGNPDVSYGCG